MQTKLNREDLNIGNIVYLKNDVKYDNPMVVSDITRIDMIECIWFNNNNEVTRFFFQIDCLMIYED
jgi:uncharacterized protein YodC (DUF2158 family)